MNIKTLRKFHDGERIVDDEKLQAEVMRDIADAIELEVTPYVKSNLITLYGPHSDPVITWPGESS